MNWGVVAQHHHLDALQSHDTVGLGPAAVIADAHANKRAEAAINGPTQVADLEIALLEVLKGARRLVLCVARQVNLAILADNLTSLVDEDRGIKAAGAARLLGQLGIAQMESESEASCFVEQRAGFGAGHLALEKSVYLLLVLHEPAWKEGGEGEFREHHQVTIMLLRLAQQHGHAAHDLGAGLVAGDGAELGCPDVHVSCHLLPRS